MYLERARDALSNPMIAGVAVVATATTAFVLARALFGLGEDDGWPALGDACAQAVYVQELGSKIGPRAWKYMPQVRYAADAFGIDPALLAGLIHTESTFQPNAGSSAGAVGLSQHIASTALGRYKKLVEQGRWPFAPLAFTNDSKESYYAEHGVPMRIDRTDPKQSLWLGAATLRALLDSSKGVTWALAAYNAGPGTANKPQDQWADETRAYIKGVPKRQGWYRRIGQICGQGALA